MPTMSIADSGFGSHATADSMIRIQKQQKRIRDFNESMIYYVYISVYYIIAGRLFLCGCYPLL